MGAKNTFLRFHKFHSSIFCPNNFVSRDTARNARQVRDIVGFELKDNIRKQGFNDRILIVHSALLGDTAKDKNSFTMRLIR